MPHRIAWSWCTGRWWVGCYILYTVLLYNGPLLCGFSVAIKALIGFGAIQSFTYLLNYLLICRTLATLPSTAAAQIVRWVRWGGPSTVIDPWITAALSRNGRRTVSSTLPLAIAKQPRDDTRLRSESARTSAKASNTNRNWSGIWIRGLPD